MPRPRPCILPLLLAALLAGLAAGSLMLAWGAGALLSDYKRALARAAEPGSANDAPDADPD